MDRNSLMPKGSHNADLREMLDGNVTFEMITYIAARATQLLKVHDEHTEPNPQSSLPSPPLSPPLTAKGGRFPEQSQRSEQPQPQVRRPQKQPSVPLEQFITGLCRGSQVGPSTLLATLIYLDRLSHKLPPHAKGIPCTRHRVFLAALIVAAKYLNDSSPKNKHWANYAGIFERDEINLMEKQLVFLLDFNLRFSEDEAILYFRPFMRGGALHLSAPFMSKENIRKLAARPIRPCATPILAPKPPVTPPAEEVLPFSTRQQQRRPQVDALPQCQTVFGPTPAPVRPPRPAPLYQIDSSDSSVSLVELTEDNGTSSSSAESSSEGEVMRVAPARFVLRPVPLDRRRKASGSAIHTSASAGAIPPTQLLNVVGRGQRIVSLNTKTEEATLPSATSVPSFLGRMFGKQQLREPRIHIASNELLPDRCREPVSREILYDADLA